MKLSLYPIMVEWMEEGGYYAECPVLQGCHVEGDTFAEVMINIQDAIKTILKSYKELGIEPPKVPEVGKSFVVNESVPIIVEEKKGGEKVPSSYR